MSTPDRSKLTTHLLSYLATKGYKVGDITAPADAGWQEQMGTPAATFIPYVVVTPGRGVPDGGSFGVPESEWMLSYTFTIYGVDRAQVEELADDVRAALSVAHAGTVVIGSRKGSESWQMIGTEITSIGGIGYTTQVTPTAYSESDTATFRLSVNL